jgi:hypothetical protein
MTATPPMSTSALQASETSLDQLSNSMISMASITVPSQMSSSQESSTRIKSEVRDTSIPTILDQPERTATAASSHSHQKTLGIATLVGATIGGTFLLLLAIFWVVCIRHRRKMRIYRAPIYVSPYNTSDVTPGSGTCHKAKSRRSYEDIQQLDSKNVGVPEDSILRCFAELPAESVTRL